MTPSIMPSQIPEEIRRMISLAETRSEDETRTSEQHKWYELKKFERDVHRALPDILVKFVNLHEEDMVFINCKELTVRAIIPQLAPVEIHLVYYRYMYMLANDFNDKEYNYRIPGIGKERTYGDITYDWHEKAMVTNELDMALLIARQRYKEFLRLDNALINAKNSVQPVYEPFVPSP